MCKNIPDCNRRRGKRKLVKLSDLWNLKPKSILALRENSRGYAYQTSQKDFGHQAPMETFGLMIRTRKPMEFIENQKTLRNPTEHKKL